MIKGGNDTLVCTVDRSTHLQRKDNKKVEIKLGVQVYSFVKF